jgi:hypothetical protein
MEQLERPDEITWDERRLWFEAREAQVGRGGTGALSEQACALMIDLQAVFCAGAWAAVVILAAVIVDAQLREVRGGPERPAASERQWLRRLRNALVHEDPTKPGFTLEDHWTRRGQWEANARRAVEAALAALYPPPGTRGRPEAGRGP